MQAVKHRALALVIALAAGVAPATAWEALRTNGRRLHASGNLLLVTAPERERVALYDVGGERPRKLGEFGGDQGTLPGSFMGPHGAIVDRK